MKIDIILRNIWSLQGNWKTLIQHIAQPVDQLAEHTEVRMSLINSGVEVNATNTTT